MEHSAQLGVGFVGWEQKYFCVFGVCKIILIFVSWRKKKSIPITDKERQSFVLQDSIYRTQ